jgi:hypothetical protein
MPWEFLGKSTNYHKVRSIHRLYTTLHKTILGFADVGSMEKFFGIFFCRTPRTFKIKKKYSRVSYMMVTSTKHIKNDKYKSGVLFSIKLLLCIGKYLYCHNNDVSASISGMMREERSLKFKFESWPPIIGGIMKVKRANRLIFCQLLMKYEWYIYKKSILY